MPLRRSAVALALLFVFACVRWPVTEEVTIDFTTGDDSVIVTAETSFEMQPADGARARIEDARRAAMNGTDPWSLRFGRVAAEEERVTFQKRRDVLERVTRSMRIPSTELQKVFSDTSITVDVSQGEGWRELRFYPGASTRATREQRLHFDAALGEWSIDVARYFTAMNRLYSYMRTDPSRARYLFAALLSEKGIDGSDPVVLEDEQPLVDAVTAAMDAIGARMDAQEGRAATFAEEADLIANPFPGRISIRIPGEPLAVEGFSRSRDEKDTSLVIEPVDLYASIAALEGQWITPDPLAVLLRDEKASAAGIAAMPRTSSASVDPGAVADAIRRHLARPAAYSVRWKDSPDPSSDR